MSSKSRPVVGVPACLIDDGEHRFHRVSDKYIQAVVNGTGCTPLLIPALGDWLDFGDMVDRLDGLFLTGSPSNVEPHRYGGTPSREGTAHDAWRDATTLPLIRAAVAGGLPLFAVCRGIQELNVALGGTLHQNVHELPGKNEHRMDRTKPRDERYAERHPVAIAPGGVLHRLSGGAETAMVNSLHAQAIDRPAPGLFVEAVSDDGIVEAVSLPEAKAFTLGVQWHPEHPIPLAWPLSQAMFGAFAEAVRVRQAARADARPDGAAHRAA